MGQAVQERERNASTTSAMLRHPLRVRILEVLNERDMSPVQFYREGLMPGYGLSHVSHHFKELRRGGCLKVIKRIRRRGSIESIHRGTARAYFSDEEWAEVSLAERKAISRTMLRGLIARADGAVMAETFDSRLDRHLTWIAMDLDDQGWKELSDLQAESFHRAEEIREHAKARIEEKESERIPATFGALAFESPPIKAESG